MRAPLSWLREYADLPAGVTGRDLADRLIAAGLEVESVEQPGAEISGDVRIGRVLAFTDEEHSNGKTIRWTTVDVGEQQPRGIVCGALNFAEGDLVVVALPGATLPGGFEIAALTTYGHVSDGMICSARELGLGDDHQGILVIAPTHQGFATTRDASSHTVDVGADAVALLRLRDEVLDIAVTPDRGYALSIRGVAREAATAYDVAFRDPADVDPLPEARDGHPGVIDDPTAADRLVLRTVTGLDPDAPSPLELQHRLLLSGMRPVSLAVDVTNYVMLEMGQPLHAFDRTRLDGPIVVRRARPGERLETLDHVTRDLDPEDVLITDGTSPVGLAGTMGGTTTEIHENSTDLVIEAAHFSPTAVARMSRRHKLFSEASKRFERGVDPELPPAASARAVHLLETLGGATHVGSTEVNLPRRERHISVAAGRPARTAGMPIPGGQVVAYLQAVGCRVDGSPDGLLTVTPPSWRPDLAQPADLDEEVIRLAGYDRIPAVLPQAPPGPGLSSEQRARRRVGQALAYAGYVEAPTYPFLSPGIWDLLGADPDDVRRSALRLANPLSDEEPDLRTALLPGLLLALRRNERRGMHDVGLFELGNVYLPRLGAAPVPRPNVTGRPTNEELAALDDALPDQPWHVASVAAGQWEAAGWWGPGRPVTWSDAVEAAHTVARAAGVELDVRRGALAPWHPGRCAELMLGGEVVGHAGELRPRSVAALGLPERTVAMELDLTAVLDQGTAELTAPRVSTFPVATQDVALVVADDVPAAEVAQALHDGAGELLESVRLFDVYRGEQLGEGADNVRSLAYSLRFRAPDRTLTVEEVSAARTRAVEEAARRTGAVQRGG
ncbi:MAG: phenylalanine--tRNA ligase subunit beta [Sporichthyaceae bacterium]